MDEVKALSFHSVSFAYDGDTVVRDVTFDVRRGMTTGVVGPNGSGKTSLIGLMSGLLKPREGKIEVLGRPLESYRRRELSRLLAVVPQANEIVFPYTVEETVSMGRYPYLGWGGWVNARDREVSDRAMELTGIHALRNRTLDHLSAGERQRVFLARALAQEPVMLLLDEASSFLDIGQEVAVFEVLDRLRREEGLTLLTVSHDLNLIGRFCQRILLMKKGHLLSDGRLEESYTTENLTTLFGVPVESEQRMDGGMRVSW